MLYWHSFQLIRVKLQQKYRLNILTSVRLRIVNPKLTTTRVAIPKNNGEQTEHIALLSTIPKQNWI